MTALIPHIGIASVCLAALAFLLGAIIERGAQLQTHLQRAVAAGALPSGLVLVYGAIDPTVLVQVPGLNIPILCGGLSLLYMSLKAATQKSS